MNLDMIWQTIRVNVRLHLAHPLGYAALILVALWATAVPTTPAPIIVVSTMSI